MAQALAYLLVVCCQPAVKSGGGGGGWGKDVFYLHLHLGTLEFSVPNNVDIDCVAGHFAQLLNINYLRLLC